MAQTRNSNKTPTVGRILEILNKVPPFYVYFAGGHCRRHSKKRSNMCPLRRTRMSIEDMAKSANIPKTTFHRLALKISWDDVQFKYIEPFCRACGVDILTMKYFRQFVRETQNSQNPYPHLTAQQKKHFETLADRHLKMMDEREAKLPLAGALPLQENPAL